MSAVAALPRPQWPWDPIIDLVSMPFEAAAGWAWDTVIGGITDWLAKGFIQLVSFVWEVMDQSSSPRLESEWFSGSAGAPYLTAVAVATGLLGIFVFCALIQGVLAGRPLELVKRMAFDTPAAVAGILFTAGFAQVGIDLVDAMSDGIWQLTRDRAVNAVDGLLLTASNLMPGSFLSPLLLLIGMLGMLMLWIVLGWTSILFGASFASSMSAFRYQPLALRLPHGYELYGLLRMLGRFQQARSAGKGLHSDEIQQLEPILTDSLVQELPGQMAAIKVVSRAEDGQWLLARDLDDVSLGELYEAAHLRVPVAEARLPHHDDALGVAVMEVINGLRMPLRDLLKQRVSCVYERIPGE